MNSLTRTATQNKVARRECDPRHSGEGAQTGRPGLVSSPITRQPLNFAEKWSPRDLWNPQFAPVDLVEVGAGFFDRISAAEKAHARRARMVMVSPGSVQLAQTQVWKEAPIDLVRIPEPEEEPDLLDLLEEPEEEPEKAPKRGNIVEWSRKSRANMVRRLATLDYMPWVNSGRLPAMVTLTLPGNWLEITPDGRTAQKKLDNWRRKYAHDWGEPLSAIWKREFQGRGAPHWHLLMMIPTGRAKTGETFKEWLSRSWVDACGTTGENREKHLNAGTGIDYAEGIRARDPRRLAIYFLKKESGASGESSKEYQHQVPKEWHGKPIGRFWGYWKLEPMVSALEVSEQDGINLSRILRRWSRAKGLRKSTAKPRNKINRKTGEIVTKYRKTSSRAYYFRGNGSGFACVNNGPDFAYQLSRAVAVMRQ